jgi:hypothetical protein
VIRGFRILATAGLLMVAAVLWMGGRPAAAGICASAALAVVAGVFLWNLRRRRLVSVLPRGLERLAWRSDAESVAFIWRFRKGHGTRVRILRSERGYADKPATAHDQTTVFDAEGDQALDRYVVPRRTYFYSFVLDGSPKAQVMLHLEIPTLSPDERRRIDETLAPPAVGGDGGRNSLATASRHGNFGSMTSSASVAGEILGGVATDAFFAVADLFARERLPDEWVEVE